MSKFERKIRDLMVNRAKCLSCSLYGRDTVIYSGDTNPDILFIGINPGKEEAVQDKPFVGRSGQLLRKSIQVAGLDKYKIAFTNAILCSTANEKEIPDVEQSIKNCKGLVLRIFRKLNPTLYIPVGSSCAKFVFGMFGSITQQTGFPLEDKSNVIPIIHPASLLYTPRSDLKVVFQNSLNRIKQYLDEGYV